jgi:serine/threonine-protein kinase RsbT
MNIADALRSSLRAHLSPILIESLVQRHVAGHDGPLRAINLSAREDIAARCVASAQLFSESNPRELRAAIRSALELDGFAVRPALESEPLAEASGPAPLLKQVIPVCKEIDVSVARHEARRLALEVGASGSLPVKVATVVSELARNIALYAAPGTITIEAQREDDAPVVRIIARDEGPGMSAPQIETVFAGTYRSKSGLGKGLLAVKRVVTVFDLVSAPGRGTTIDVSFRGAR